MKFNKKLISFLLILICFSSFVFYRVINFSNWRQLSRDSAGISPKNPQTAIVQVFAARTIGWKGAFAVHSWVSYKRKNDDQYTVAEVMGWLLKRSSRVIRQKKDIPDRLWFGSEPILIEDIRGEKASKAIARLENLIDNYSDRSVYKLWPGPNSNSFIAHLIRNTEELSHDLPPHAIGKDWINKASFFSRSASGKGFQLSLYGLLGLNIDLINGIEVNILSLNFGVDFICPALKVPITGRLGFNKSSCD